jgi:myosin heavy subunit
METNQSKSRSNRLYAGIIAILVILNCLTFYQLYIQNVKKTDLTSQKASLEHQFKDLSDTLFMRTSELEQFRGKNAELDKVITEKQQQLDGEKKLIQSLFTKNKLTQAELSKARDLIAEYRISITDLTAKVDELDKQNRDLMARNSQLDNDLNTEKSTTAKLTEQNKGLAKKVEVGSLLPLASLDVEAVKHRRSGKEVEVKRARAAESLRISFETGENKVLDPGPVSLYVRIINPKGETIAVSDQGSGTIAAAQSPEPVQFTKKADFDYDQNNKKVVVYWSENIKDPGLYKVEVYQNGYVVGQGQVKLS